MLINDKYHLSYSTNIHPGEGWKGTFKNLAEYIPSIKSSISEDKPFGIGLSLTNLASQELNKNYNLIFFKEWLESNNLYVHTINGYLYGGEAYSAIKDAVHLPDWTTKERFKYTKRLIAQLALLLPENMNGSITTSPLSYKHWHTSEALLENSYKSSAKNLAKTILELYKVELKTGKYIHLDLEPEPDTLIENSNEVINFFRGYLAPIAVNYLVKKLKTSEEIAEYMVYRYINICYDVCHFSLVYEEPELTFKRFKQTGIKVGKVQLSSALKVVFEEHRNDLIIQNLFALKNSDFLHQVREKIGDQVVKYHDFHMILNKKQLINEIRAQFHVPVFIDKFGALNSTQDQLIKVIKCLKEQSITDHIEVETYTWEILPEDLRKDLKGSIVRELCWVKEQLKS
ncbi:metabolite traffic protein EboE [Zhouia amylolytica]|uniref:metabolite traffic protein EboE n=1 Tax=Zhouia amylolytica TaxID=376730 RepID=UPI0020CC30D3|nr:metabolite traffic protein EboE [Zhouia amylolytica]MCQ0112652.1 metabolite traffic protein EboE [Zhouia amylolytica]